MELGALKVKPKDTLCQCCPIMLDCCDFKIEAINRLPFTEKKIKQKNRYFNYLVLLKNDFIYLTKRGENDIWKGLYDFPLIETKNSIITFDELINLEANIFDISKGLALKSKSIEYKHILSHQKIYATFWLVSGEFQQLKAKKCAIIKCSLKEINNYPVPKLIDNYLKTIV